MNFTSSLVALLSLFYPFQNGSSNYLFLNYYFNHSTLFFFLFFFTNTFKFQQSLLEYFNKIFSSSIMIPQFLFCFTAHIDLYGYQLLDEFNVVYHS